MKRCLQLAQRAKGYTRPNPMVGALLVSDGLIIGEGWHRQYGGAHAELNCLAGVSEANRSRIRGSTMYVSLEPCAHSGHTPPCATALVKEGIKRVVIANGDPNSEVNGKGVQILREAGIDVETDLLYEEGRWVNRRFFCYHEQARPYIILKWAQTPEGYIAPPGGGRLKITGNASLQLMHKWRTEEAAIMVGAHTALTDDPSLTARLWEGRQPLRIVIDNTLRLPHTLQLFDSHAATWIVNEQRETLDGNVRYIQVTDTKPLMPQLLKRLHEIHITSVMIEGGRALLQSCIDAGLWDEARIFTGTTPLSSGIEAPHIAGGSPAFSVSLAGDLLNIHVNNKSRYRYVNGWEL